MSLHVHEIHPAVIHAPLVLLPAAAAVDVSAALSGSRSQARLGRTLWWMAVGSGLFAGLTGMAASQEVKAEDQHADDMMWLHGIANLGIVCGGLGMALWRTSRKPTLLQSAIGAAAAGLGFYTAYLGGEMVYTHGIGVKAMPGYVPQGMRDSPPLLSRAAPATFLRDAVGGLVWLFARAARAISRRQPIARGAVGFGASPVPSGRRRDGMGDELRR